MNKKVMKVISILLVAIMVVSISVTSFADGSKELKGPTSVTIDASQASKISDYGGVIIGTLQTAGVVLSIIILIIIGIKYMLGSPEEKSEYKKTLLPYVVGAALIFAASALSQILFTFFRNFSA